MQKLVAVVVLLAVGRAIALAMRPALPDKAQDWISDTQEQFEKRTKEIKETVTNRDAFNSFERSIPTPESTIAPTDSIAKKATVGGVPLSELTAGDIFEMERDGKITEGEAAEALTKIKGLQDDESRATTTPRFLIQTTPAEITRSESDGHKAFLLEPINLDRSNAGQSQLTLGTHSAAQSHAEEMLENSYLSHWGLDGYKPYMRYAMAGGISRDSENTSGIETELEAVVRYRKILSVEVELR